MLDLFQAYCESFGEHLNVLELVMDLHGTPLGLENFESKQNEAAGV